MKLGWDRAFALQAKSDLDMLRALLRLRDVPACHRLHYLQMAAEKASKSFVTPPTGPPAYSHRALVKFIRGEAKMNPSLMRSVGFAFDKKAAYLAYLRSLEPIAAGIEALAPAVSPPEENTEYPWVDSAGEIVVPALHRYALDPLANPATMKLIWFIERCLAERLGS